MGKVLKLFVEELRHCYLTEEHHSFMKYKLASYQVTIVTEFGVFEHVKRFDILVVSQVYRADHFI